MKTLKQMADELGVPKQRLYRFVKQAGISEVHQENKTMYYDETAETAIKFAFENVDVHQVSDDVHRNADEVNQTETHDTPNDADDVHQKNSDVHHDVLLETQKHNEKVIEALQHSFDVMQAAYQKEIENRDEQIRQLQKALEEERMHSHEVSDKLAQLADQAQQLQLVQMQPPALPVPDEETPKQKPSFWRRIFGKKE